MKYFLRTIALLYFIVAIALAVLGLTGLLFGWDDPGATALQVFGMIGAMWALAALLLFSARRARQIEEKVTLPQIVIIFLPAILLVTIFTLIGQLPN